MARMNKETDERLRTILRNMESDEARVRDLAKTDPAKALSLALISMDATSSALASVIVTGGYLFRSRPR